MTAQEDQEVYPISAEDAMRAVLATPCPARVKKELLLLSPLVEKEGYRPPEIIREVALKNNYSLALHRILDQAGVPFLEEKEASRLGAQAVDRLMLNSFQEIALEHPCAMRKWLSEVPAIASLKIACGLATGKDSKKRRKMFALASCHGADWALHRPTIIEHYAKSLALYDEVVAQATQYAMEQATPAPQPSARPGPRL